MAHFVIMGAGRVGVMVAHALEDSGHSVAVIDQDDLSLQRLRKDFQGRRVTGTGFDRDVLRRAGIEEAYAFAAVSSGDNSNIIAARVARETFRVRHVVARIYDPSRAEFYQRMGIPTVAAVRWSADQVIRRLLPEESASGEYRESSGRLQLTVLDVDTAWSGVLLSVMEEAAGMRVAYLTRFGEGILPSPHTSYQEGDLLAAMVRIPELERVARILSRPPAAPVLDRIQEIYRADTDPLLLGLDRPAGKRRGGKEQP